MASSSETFTSQQNIFLAQKKMFIMAVAFCNRKQKKTKKVWQSGSSLTVFKIIRTIHLRTKKKKQGNKFCAPTSVGRAASPPAGCEASSCSSGGGGNGGSSALLQHALDSLVGRFVVQMLGCVPAGDNEGNLSAG